MKILLTNIQWLHLNAFVQKYGYNRFVAGFNINSIEFKVEDGDTRAYNAFGSMTPVYWLEVNAFMSVDAWRDFLQHIKDI